MLFIFPAFLRQTFVENRRAYFGFFAATYAERGGRHLTLWNQGDLIAIKWLNGHSWRQFCSWYGRTGVGNSTAEIVHTCGYQYELQLLQLRSEPYLLGTSRSPSCKAMQSFSSSSLFHHSLSGFGIRRQWAVWAKNLLYLFLLAPIKRTAAHFYSTGGPVWAGLHISSCRTFTYSEQILGNQNRTRRLVTVSVRWSPFAAARLRLTCASRLSSAERRGDRTAR